MKNQITNKNNNFIEKKSQNAKFVFAFVYNSNTFGVWIDYSVGKVFVSFDYMKNSYYIFSMTLTDHSPNYAMINSLKKYNFWKTFIENFKLGIVYFENQKIKHSVFELVKNLHKI